MKLVSGHGLKELVVTLGGVKQVVVSNGEVVSGEGSWVTLGPGGAEPISLECMGAGDFVYKMLVEALSLDGAEMERLELVLRSPANLRVLRVLLQNRGKYITKYFISKETGIPNPSRIIERLLRLGWVEEQNIGGHRRYRIKIENPKVRALHEFFEKVGYL